MAKIDTSKKLSEIVIDMMRQDGTTQMMLEHRAETLWHAIMGPTVKRNTASVRVHDGVMYVGLTSSVVRNELFNMKGKILEALNKAVGQDVVKDIIFR